MNPPRVVVKSTRKPKSMSPDTWTEPDLVDRVWDYLLRNLPEIKPRETAIKAELRAEFGGQEVYVRKERAASISAEIGKIYNGRNATEVARRLGISRVSVWRHLKQAGKAGR